MVFFDAIWYGYSRRIFKKLREYFNIENRENALKQTSE